MRPIIAMLASIDEKNQITINRDYLTAINNSGGIGVVVPHTLDDVKISEYAKTFDGFVFCGGSDIDPKYYGEEKHSETKNICSLRDEFEYKIFNEIYPLKKPILAICRGEQAVNVFLGGTLHQHIENHVQTEKRHVTKQKVTLTKNGYLHRLLGREEIYTNSFHHQCVACLGRGLICDGVSFDGYIEAFHSSEHPFCVGVQWHPENFYDLEDSSSKIFDSFISACLTQE
jgi:putative glutamine amidotransferase